MRKVPQLSPKVNSHLQFLNVRILECRRKLKVENVEVFVDLIFKYVNGHTIQNHFKTFLIKYFLFL